ncbi:Retrotransposon gag protein [Arachis hypogaea]|nr:Retrotransposon gag protein [Arachis hypogaea]
MMMKKSKHRGVGVKELLKWRAIQQKEKIQIEGDFTDPEPDYEESKALDSTIGYVKEGTVSLKGVGQLTSTCQGGIKPQSYDQQVIAKVCNDLTFVARLVNTDLILIMSLLCVGGKRRNTFCRRTLLRKKSSFLQNTYISLLESDDPYCYFHPEGWNLMWSFSSIQAINTYKCYKSYGKSINVPLVEIYDTVKTNGVDPEVYKLMIFPFAMRDRAREWLDAQPKESLNTWNKVMRRPLGRERASPSMMLGYKLMLRKCPPDMFSNWIKLDIFYVGLSDMAKMSLNNSVDGSLHMKKTLEDRGVRRGSPPCPAGSPLSGGLAHPAPPIQAVPKS